MKVLFWSIGREVGVAMFMTKTISSIKTFFLIAMLWLVATSSYAYDLSPYIEKAKELASSKVIVEETKKRNLEWGREGSEHAKMDNDKWKKLSTADPFVVQFIQNPAGQYLQKNVSSPISEAFVNSADGTKVAFLAKTTSWCHKGKDKHDIPMSGKNWVGKLEKDESTGKFQIQIAVPVLDGKKMIGSLVLGVSAAALEVGK